MQVALSGIILLISGLAVQKSNLTNTVKDGISGDANGIYELKVRALDLVYAVAWRSTGICSRSHSSRDPPLVHRPDHLAPPTPRPAPMPKILGLHALPSATKAAASNL